MGYVENMVRVDHELSLRETYFNSKYDDINNSTRVISKEPVVRWLPSGKMILEYQATEDPRNPKGK